jgi:hypothetical protein
MMQQGMMGMGAGGRFGGGAMMQQAQMGGYGMDEGYGGETRSVPTIQIAPSAVPDADEIAHHMNFVTADRPSCC